MARARNLKPSFFTNDVLAEIAPLGRLLFQGLWCLADREGRLEDRPKRIKAELLPYDECEAEALLCALSEKGFILRYESSGNRYIQVISFCKHQNPHVKEAASTIPAPCSHGASQMTDREIPEAAGLIPPSPFPLPDSPSLIPPLGFPLEEPREKTLLSSSHSTADEIEQIFGYWQKTMNSPTSKLDDKRRKAIKAALAMNYAPRDLCRAIRGCSLTPHNMGQNDRGQKYNGIALIFRSADQIDRFIANELSPPRQAPPQTASYHDERAATIAGLTGEDRRYERDDRTIDV